MHETYIEILDSVDRLAKKNSFPLDGMVIVIFKNRMNYCIDESGYDGIWTLKHVGSFFCCHKRGVYDSRKSVSRLLKSFKNIEKVATIFQNQILDFAIYIERKP